MSITNGFKLVKRISRFVSHLYTKIPMWWAISKHEFQLDSIWATDEYDEHLVVIEEMKKCKERITKRIPEAQVLRTSRVSRI